MKIGLNATCFDARPSGAKQRFIGLYSELFKSMSGHNFVVYEPADCRLRYWFEPFENVKFIQTPLLSQNRFQKVFRGVLYWRESLSKEDFDVFEMFNLPALKVSAGRTLLTIHDVRGVSENTPWYQRLFYKIILGRSIAVVDEVITVSESVSQEIHDSYPQASISVIPNGVDIEKFRALSDNQLERVRQERDLPDSFLLSVGHFEKRKNYLSLIDAVSELRKKDPSIYLVIVGNDSGELIAIQEKIKQLELQGSVMILSDLPDTEVCALYRLCKLVVFPSSYEGFGIPILEAMAAGVPFVLSDIPVFLEITEGRCEYFPYDDSHAMAETIHRVLHSTKMCERLVKYGNQRVQNFSFSNVVVELATLYRSINRL